MLGGSIADVRLPGDAVDGAGKDIVAPAEAVLQRLFILPTEVDLKDAGRAPAIFLGPPQSVAVIEAGATAFSKVWATGLGASVVTVWASFARFWRDEPPSIQGSLVFAISIATAAAILALGYIVGSDVRGRAAAAVATIEARASVAETVVRAAQGKDEEATASTITSLQPRSVRYSTKPGPDENGWVALAMRSKPDGADPAFLLVKGGQNEWATASEVDFLTS